MTNDRRKFYFGLLILTVLFILTALLCLNIGRYHVPLRKMISVLVNFRDSMISEPKLYSVVFKIRLPRILLAAFVGAGLSIAGATFPVFAMSPMLEAVAQLFPLRHYYMLYQLCVLNGFPLSAAWLNLLALLLFCFLPFVSLWNIKRAMLLYTYLP